MSRSRNAWPRGSMIWTMKVKLVFGLYAEGPWEAAVEIASSATLVGLYLAIQGPVQFSDDHILCGENAQKP